MRIGLTGGIASGKTIFEKELHKLGYPIFETDKIDMTLRTGLIQYNKDDDVFRYEEIIDFTRELSNNVISELKKYLPNLYNEKDEFVRQELLNYIDHDESSSENYELYKNALIPSEMELYLEWCNFVEHPFVLSSGVLVESGYLEYIDKLYMIETSEEQQIKNIISREIRRGYNISEEDAKKKIARQYNLDKKVQLSKSKLGPDNVFIILI
jgi:dephospho-CoA kinase